jgi:hypothetical protein
MVGVVGVVQRYPAAAQKMVVVAAQAAVETDAAEALRLLLGRQTKAVAVVAAVMLHNLVAQVGQGLQLSDMRIHIPPLYRPQARQLLLFPVGSALTHSLVPAQSHSFNYGPLC